MPDLTSLDVESTSSRSGYARCSTSIRSRHALALHELMSEREDLHGVHALADQIADSLRWSA